MNPREAGAAIVRRLIAELTADRQALHARQAELDAFVDAWSGTEAGQAAALALVLDRTYTGLETLLERAVRTLDGDLPEGPDWHRTLLSRARMAIPKVRPPILGRSADAADALRRFRHFVRRAYAAPLDAARVREIATGWRAARPSLEADLDELAEFLDGLADRLERG